MIFCIINISEYQTFLLILLLVGSLTTVILFVRYIIWLIFDCLLFIDVTVTLVILNKPSIL
jgi:hypothetical protein